MLYQIWQNKTFSRPSRFDSVKNNEGHQKAVVFQGGSLYYCFWNTLLYQVLSTSLPSLLHSSFLMQMTFFQLSVNCLPQFTDTSSLVSEWHNKCHPTVLVNMSTNVILTLDQCFSQLTTNTSALKFKPGFVLTLISISFSHYQHIPSCNLLGWGYDS